MKSFIVFVFTLLFIHQLSAQSQKPFALVELYTSQGCSSCPRADKYLAEIITEAETKEQNIIALSFHVDYWNRLGWRDPYSSSSNTQRQYDYAKSMKSSNVYTPQMVVNGTVEFVGANRQVGGQAIRKALDEPKSKSIRLGRVESSKPTVTIDYEVIGGLEGERLNIAIAEKGITTKIGKGENGGRTLSHENVVRAFKSYALMNTNGKVQINMPEDIVIENAIIVAFLQKEDLSPIEAATSIPLQ